jgi:hypothetical protein
MNDNGDDDSPANPFSHRGDIDPDLSEATELHRCDLFDRRRPCRLNSLTVPGCLQPVAEMNPVKLLSRNLNGGALKIDGKRRRTMKRPTFHQPYLSLITGIPILSMPRLPNLIIAISIVVTGI